VSEEQARQVIFDLATKRFKDAKIIDVTVKEDTGWDGDPILRVRVIYETPNERLDAPTMMSFKHCLWLKFEEMEIDAFPITSYISSRDAKDAGMIA